MTTTPRRPLPSQDRSAEYRLTISVDGLDLTTDDTPDPSWVTLRQAADRSGVNPATVRNWARKGRVASRLVERSDGLRRMVDLDDVLRRADRTDAAVTSDESAATGPPEGHMLVPLDAWEKMLLQLGNLHEAGQQLAEARERAAKAETEAAFLRERLAELRTRSADTEPGPPHPPAAPARTASPPTWREMVRRLLARP